VARGEGGRRGLSSMWAETAGGGWRLTAEVGGVRSDCAITYGRCGKTTRQVRAYASTNAPGGR